MAPVWYFAYGSNMQTSTFCGRRGVTFSRALPACAPGWCLVVDKPPLLPVGEAFANIVRDPTTEVFGVLYEITAEELAHVELTEGVLIGNYDRVEIAVTALASPSFAVTASTLTSDRRDPALQPSDRYMACLVAGAEEHGLPAPYVARLRAIPTRPQTPEAIALRSIVDDVLARRR